jgi:hypothetical protein
MAVNSSIKHKIKTFKFIFITLCCLLFIQARAQKPDLEKTITINVSNAPLEDVLVEVAEKGQLKFSYSKKQIPADLKISLNEKNKPIREVLDKISSISGIQYLVVEDQVVLKQKKEEEEPVPQKPVIPKYTINGFLKDTLNGEILIGAVVGIKELAIGTFTNVYGFYSFSLPKGTYTLIYSYLGYLPQEQVITLTGNKTISVKLTLKEIELNEVVISAVEKQNIVRTNQLSEVKLNPLSISKVPSMLGEGDVLKAIFQMPGVKFFADGSTMYSVRGGEKDQNYLILDDAPVFNPSHLLGMFSTLVPDVVKSVTLYKGDMPASQGGRLSSVLDIRTKDGNMNEFNANGSIGILTTKVAIEGPIVKEKSSYFLSFRKSHLNWYINEKENPNLKLVFYDVNGKVNVNVKDKHRFYLSFYAGKDNYRIDDAGINWENGLASVRWNYIPSSNMFLNTTMYASKYIYKFVTSFNENNYWHNSISNFGLKEDFTYYLTPKNTLKSGMGLNSYNFDPGNFTLSDSTLLRNIPIVPTLLGTELYLYLSDEVELWDVLSIRAGLRLSNWQNSGPATQYLYASDGSVYDTIYHKKGENYNKHGNLEPRLSAKLNIASNHSVKLGYTRTSQYIQLVSNSISPFTSFEVWLPCSKYIKPQLADQYTLGYYYRIPEKSIDFSVEGFYKKMYNQLDYTPHAQLLLNPYIEGELLFGTAKSYGVEFLVKKETGKLNGWVGYTWSRVFKQTQGISNNQEYPSAYDSPHNVSINLSYSFTARLNFGINWLYNTGTWTTVPTSFYYYNGYSVPIYSQRNNARLPDYHRMDVSLTYQLNKPGKAFKHSINLSIFNLYNRVNPIYLNFNKTIDETGKIVVPSNLQSPQTLYPTQMYMYGIVPSLTYYFSF